MIVYVQSIFDNKIIDFSLPTSDISSIIEDTNISNKNKKIAFNNY